MLKAIVFDFDGIIVNSEPLHYKALVHTTRTFGYEFDFDTYIDRYIGYDDRGSFNAMLTDAGKADRARDAAYIAQLCQMKQDAFVQVMEEGIESYPGVPAFIDHVASIMPIAIASGATTQDIEIALEKLKLRDRFQIIVSADFVTASKPDPATYRIAVQKLAAAHPKLNLEPGDCLSIEDTAAGVASARGAGLLSLAVTTTGPAQALSKAHRVIPKLEGLTVTQLRQWFD